MKVVIAPDSFKGSISNFDAAEAIAEGWHAVRPQDQLVLKAMADGGEGTLETIAASHPDSQRITIALPHNPHWLLLADGTAVVELANICGLTLLPELNPMQAHTYELGMVLRSIALDSRVEKIVLTVGGSASTDGGAGVLVGLGAQLLNKEDLPIALGGSGLLELVRIDLSNVVPAPRGGVTCLVDVTNPLLGSLGSAAVFAPQKGASSAQVIELEAGLKNLQRVAGVADFPGAGAAGGTPYGLSVAWDISLNSGALAVAELIGLTSSVENCDLVITGEGRFDSQSNSGKVVGTVVEIASRYGKRVNYCVGSSELPLGADGVALINIAPSFDEAMFNTFQWLVEAGRRLALQQTD
jgi:glycerate 2-kinase